MHHPINHFIKLLIFSTLSTILVNSFTHICAQEKIAIEEEIRNCIKDKTNDSSQFRALQELFDKYATSNFNKTIKISNTAIEIANTLDNTTQLKNWYGKMSQLCMRYGLYSSALDYIQLVQKYQNNKEENEKWWLINIGNIYYADGSLEQAMKYYKNALAGFVKANDKVDTIGVIVSYFNIAKVNEGFNNIDSALFYYHKTFSYL